VKYKIFSVGNQWVISQIINGESTTVGKISLKPNNSTFFNIKNSKAILTSRSMNDKTLFTISTDKHQIKSTKIASQPIKLSWQNTSTKDIIFDCINHNGLYYLQIDSIIVAKCKQLSSNHIIFEILKRTDFPAVIILAGLFPLFSN
jgi:hypothetical protein